MSEWQPINTAPKDGTRIFVYGPHEVYGHYFDVCPFYAGRWTVVWMDGHGEPTHWMPLPAPPVTP